MVVLERKRVQENMKDSFLSKLKVAWKKQQSLLQIGLDPNPEFFPIELRNKPGAIFQFCRGIVDSTAPYACSFKPQIAFFSANRAEEQLEDLCAYIRRNYPDLPIVMDAKRGDIGSTSEQYARESFERYQANAVTVNPYMGFDSIEPYLAWKDRGIMIVCHTSNPRGNELQLFSSREGLPLYLHLADLVVNRWNTNNQCGLVVGATFPNQIKAVRQRIGDCMPLLIPGIGAQGGNISVAVKSGINKNGTGLMISSSRAIIYSSNQENWREAAANAAKETRDLINSSF